MNLYYSFLIAVSMYSKIPFPTVEWTRQRLRYVMCFFPVVGIFCGFFMGLWFRLADLFHVSPLSAGIFGTVIPILVTGGIHMDGFLDTLDARSCYGDREKKLEILKDPHTGAFAIIGCCAYFLIYSACLVQLFTDAVQCGQGQVLSAFYFVFPLERSLSGLAVACFPCAKNSGLAYTFSDSAQKHAVKITLLFWIACIFLLLFFMDRRTAFLILSVSLLAFLYYNRMAVREFGGITGDLAGWFLQVTELLGLAGLTAFGRWAAGY